MVDEDVANMPLYGTILPCTCREALRQVLFACNAAVDTSNSEYIHMYHPAKEVAAMVTRETKISTSATVSSRVSGVKIEYDRKIIHKDSTIDYIKKSYMWRICDKPGDKIFEMRKVLQRKEEFDSNFVILEKIFDKPNYSFNVSEEIVLYPQDFARFLDLFFEKILTIDQIAEKLKSEKLEANVQ